MTEKQPFPPSKNSSANPPAPKVEELTCRLAIYQGLVRVSALINSITDFGQMLEATLDVARDVLDAEAASLFFPKAGGDGLELKIATSGTGFSKPDLVIPRGNGLAWWALDHKEAVLVADAYSDPRFYSDADRSTGFQTRSMLCSPLIHNGEPIGVLQVLNPRNKMSFDAADLEAIQGYSSLIATALEKIRAMESQRKQELLHRDLAIAAEIQQGLLARAIPSDLKGLKLHALNRPAQEVGGDFYFVAEDSLREHTFFAIGDVSGKGIAAAMLMNQTISALDFLLRDRIHPDRALEKLNNSIYRLVVRGMFVTILLGRISHKTDHLEVASAGHCAPWILRPGSAPREWIPGSAMPVGIVSGTKYRQSRCKFPKGDSLVLFTDGLSESRSEDGSRFFGDQIASTLAEAGGDPETICRHLLNAEGRFRGSAALRDDLTILALTRK